MSDYLKEKLKDKPFTQTPFKMLLSGNVNFFKLDGRLGLIVDGGCRSNGKWNASYGGFTDGQETLGFMCT